MEEQTTEQKVDKYVNNLERKLLKLPLPIRVIGDLVCIGVCVYILGWIIHLFGPASPHAWGLKTWLIIAIVILAGSSVYEIVIENKKKHKKKEIKK